MTHTHWRNSPEEKHVLGLHCRLCHCMLSLGRGDKTLDREEARVETSWISSSGCI